MKRHILSLAIILFAPFLVDAQPYYFFYRNQEGTIYQIDLSNNITRAFLSELQGVRDLRWDPEQRFLFVDSDLGLEVYLIQQPTIHHVLIENVGDYGGIEGLLTSGNRLYVTWLKEDVEGLLSTTDIFNLDGFSHIGSTPVGIGNGAIVDDAGATIYQYAVNEDGEGYVEITSLTSNKVVGTIPFGEIGPATEMKTLLGGSSGKVLFSFKMESGFLHQQYVVVDLKTRGSGLPVSFPWRSTAYLSPDASRIIVEEVLFERSPQDPREYKPGNVRVFDAASGGLLQKLTLPPEGTILLFKNYPNRLFYLTPGDYSNSISIDLKAITPTSGLIDSLISSKHQAFARGWLGDHTFVTELDNALENAKKQLARGDSENCRKQLETFREKVKREYEKKATPGGKRFVTEDAYKTLWFDALHIIERLRP